MPHCPLCRKTDFTYKQVETERAYEVRCEHCQLFVIEDGWLRHLGSLPDVTTLDQFRLLTQYAATQSMVFRIGDSVFGRAPY